jgi:CubicO group peptidase (beta-lactamase class C family)
MKYYSAGAFLLPLFFFGFGNNDETTATALPFAAFYKFAQHIEAVPQHFIENASPEMQQKYAAEMLLLREAVANDIVLLRNPPAKPILPYRNLADKRIAVLHIGSTASAFEQTLNRYTKINAVSLPLTLSASDTAKGVLYNKLKAYNSFIFAYNDAKPDALAKSNVLALVHQLMPRAEFVVVNLGDAANLSALGTQAFATKAPILQANSIAYTQQDCAAQILMGGIGASGKLAQNVGTFKAGNGYFTTATRFKYTIPEEIGIDGARLDAIDRLLTQSVQQHVFPGCQVLIAKSGKVFYNKSFGNHEYNGGQTVQNNDLYDIASITKSAATTVAIMKLVDEGKINVSGTLGQYLPEAAQSTLQNITIRELLTHTSGLPPTLPIGRLQREFGAFSAPNSAIKVANGMFLKPEALTQLFAEVYQTPVYGRGSFRYSDANFNLLGRVVAQVSTKNIDEYCKSIYAPMGLRRILFNPLAQFQQYEIAPTEQDNTFRHQLLRGYVHDESAALMGGLGGNAGLFSNANDLGAVFQMLLNKGNYGGAQVISAATVQEFVGTTTAHHRGYGFDKQSPQTKGIGRLPSVTTFGHTGFTGTCAWADPQNELLFIFLSNRVNPSRSNLINKLDIREKAHDIVYQALNSKK